MLNVAIAVDSPTDYGPRAVEVIVAACEEVIGEQRCPAASELAPGMVTAWYALVHPSDPGLGSVRIEFRDRTADGTLIEERALTFAQGASQQSRLTSIGSVIAALAAAREGGPIPPRERPPAEPKLVPPPPPTQPAPASRSPDFNVGLAGFAAPSLAAGPYRFGALGSAHLGLGSRPFALIGARYAVHPESPKFSWLALSAGLGTRLAKPSAPFNLELAGEFVFERTSATVEHDGKEAAASHNGWGARFGVSGVWMAWRHAGFVAGVDATWVLPRIRVEVAGQDVAKIPFVSVALSVGMRFQP